MASAAKVTAVMPCFPYARQPEQGRGQRREQGMPLRTASSLSFTSFVDASAVGEETSLDGKDGEMSEADGQLRRAASIAEKQQQISKQLSEQNLLAIADNNGYKCWQARSGTLVANMLMAAGIVV